jgi:hypothetical protein
LAGNFDTGDDFFDISGKVANLNFHLLYDNFPIGVITWPTIICLDKPIRHAGRLVCRRGLLISNYGMDRGLVDY